MKHLQKPTDIKTEITLADLSEIVNRPLAGHWKRTWWFLAAAVVAFALPGRAEVVVSNLTEPGSGSFAITSSGGDDYYLAQAFTTGAIGAPFESVTLDLAGSTGGSSVLVWLLKGINNVGNNPEKFLLSGTTVPTNAGLYTYTATETVTLEANTTYYVRLQNRTQSTTVFWNTTASTNETGLSGWSIGDTAFTGYYYTPGGSDGPSTPVAGTVARMSVNAVPEPSATALLLVAGALAAAHRRRVAR